MKIDRTFGLIGLAIAALTVFLAPLPAWSQNCALCYTQASSAGMRMIQALRSGILILIAPPTFMTVGMIFVCYRKRNQTRDDDGDESDRKWKNDDPSDDTPPKDR